MDTPEKREKRRGGGGAVDVRGNERSLAPVPRNEQPGELVDSCMLYWEGVSSVCSPSASSVLLADCQRSVSTTGA